MTNCKANFTSGLILGLLALGGPALASGDNIDMIRAETAKYRDVNVALADGFIPDPSGQCVSAAAEGLPAELGAMGIHYINPQRLGLFPPGGRVNGNGLETDFVKPTILLYEPQADGSVKLVGVENLVFQAAWKAAGHSEPPAYGSKVWDTMTDMADTNGDEAHGFEPHYDLHVWTERENPSGMFTAFNPAVTCPKG